MGLLLDYAFSTDPAPLQVSTAATNTTGRINVSVADPTKKIYCNELLLAVPLGDDAAQLAAVANVPTASINTAAWNPSTMADVGDLDGDATGATWAKYTFKAASTVPSDWLIDANNLAPSLAAIVNLQPGQFTYAVHEMSGTDPTNLQLNQGLFTLQKVLPQFYVQNLVAVAPTAPTVPATEFALGDPILLEWESNGTWFELFQKGTSTPIYAGTATSFKLSRGLLTDTTFVLVASVTGNPGTDSPSTGYETVVLYDTITVTVSNPALTPTSVLLDGKDLATELATITKSLVPAGAIGMWSGAATSIPSGWALCDGTKGTPDLRDRFVRGANPGQTQPGATGGNDTHTHAATVTVTVQSNGAHTHGMPPAWYSNVVDSDPDGSRTIVDRRSTDPPWKSTEDGDHTHVASAIPTIAAADSLPRWWSLCFIMKLP